MTEHPFTLADIVYWCRLKQHSLEGSGVSITNVRQRTEHLPAVAADFSGRDAMGRINGWVSGEFDFEIVRPSDGKQLFFRHLEVSSVDALEPTYVDFLRQLLSIAEPDGPS